MRWRFDADAAEFTRAADLLRVGFAGLHDPMAAAASSDVDLCPHQIRAMHGELLPGRCCIFCSLMIRGAGKTIMAGP